MAVFRLNSVKSVLLVVIPGQGDDIELCNTTYIAVRTISDDAHLCQPQGVVIPIKSVSVMLDCWIAERHRKAIYTISIHETVFDVKRVKKHLCEKYQRAEMICRRVLVSKRQLMSLWHLQLLTFAAGMSCFAASFPVARRDAPKHLERNDDV